MDYGKFLAAKETYSPRHIEKVQITEKSRRKLSGPIIKGIYYGL